MKRGAHVALLGDNRPRLYAAMSAAQCLGAIVVPLYQYATADEIVSSLQGASVTHVFAENQEQVDKLLAILPRCPSLRCIVYDKDRGMRHYRQPELVSYADLLEQGRQLIAEKRSFVQGEVARGSGEDAAFVFFTSGTTGPARGVVLTHAALIDRARVAAEIGELTDADVAMAYLPPGWIGQNLFGYVQPMVVGYCICCPESSDTMLSDMREMGPTYLLATPRVLEALLKQVSLRMEETGGVKLRLYRYCMEVARQVDAQRLAGTTVSVGDRLVSLAGDLLIRGPIRDVLGMSRVRVAYTAGDAIDPDLLMFFRALGINLKQLYGSTETGFFVALQRDDAVRPDTVGLPVQGVEVKLTPQREILVRSPGLFREYHGDSAATAQAKNAEGWFHTGDAGHLGEDGQLRIIDRMAYVGALKDGSPFAPKLIENKLKFLPYIREAVAFGDGRAMVCALIDIDLAAAGRWADRRSISYMGHADLASRDEIYGLIAGCIADVNAQLASELALASSQIHRFAILSKELSADDGALTRTGKLKRDAVAKQYRALVEAMYDGRTEFRLEGGFGEEAADVKIRDAKPAASAPARRAA
ncbi:MAG: long-chain fatty acid--CoA ligase [Bradyrhizobium icense]|nr:MAG: long-chain fatty acid--CoA ligase [Bradyrhizobium icense]